ncbi:response regulator transcription factor [Kineosporia sp. A_224]|uniref:response regulator n=1 Tax=Kineosporia sp. A_224 TaxID=1962180 RepID=UPI000B4ABD37|nr:response regulator transcription factor [Kineosporia sp. A_224]
MIRVLVVDDQPVVRVGFAAILAAHEGIEVVGDAADGEQAVDAARRLVPDVVLMDVRMPVLDGIEATRRITGGDPAAEGAAGSPRVLVLTTFDLDEYVFAGLRAGASGFLLKDCTPAALVEAVRVVAAGEALLAPSVTRRLVAAFAALPGPGGSPARPVSAVLDVLTPREREVLVLVAEGLSNAEIAARLVVGEETVKTHVGRVLAKLGLRDRVQAVVLAYESGVVVPGGAGRTPDPLRGGDAAPRG